MMMKIFGAALIVSGGYLIGWVHTRQWKQRLKVLYHIRQLFQEFDQELREYRRSINEVFLEKGEIAASILANEPINGLLREDQNRISEYVSEMKGSSFNGSVEHCAALLSWLEATIKKLEEDTASTGKALPLVTGAIGLLIAVLLF